MFGVENFPGERLPFKGSATGEVVERVLEGEADLQVAQIKAAAVGTFTHAGKSAVQFTYTEQRSVSGAGFETHAAGTFLLVAADGSTLSGTFASEGESGNE